MLGNLLPGGSPLKAGPKGGAAQQGVLNGAMHGRQASAGSDAQGGGLFGPPGGAQQLSLAAAAAWGARSAHSSLDSGAGLAPPGAGAGKDAPSSGSSGSEALLPGLGGRYDQRSTADSWLAKGRLLV